MATQNPIEQEGTYPLPEAQVDRFMLKVKIEYPNRSEELEILRRMAGTGSPADIRTVASGADILVLRKFLNEVYVDPSVEEYIVDIVHCSRNPARYGLEAEELIRYGASPRGTIFLTLAAKAKALLEKRSYVIPEDIRDVAPDVLRHRIIVSYEAEAEGLSSDDILSRVFETIPTP